MQVLSFSGSKNPKILPVGPFFSSFCRRWNVYQSALTNSWLHACTIMAYPRVTLGKNWFINSLVQHLKKNHEHAKGIDLRFHNLKFSQKVILGFHVTTATAKVCMKELIDSSLCRAFWRKIMDTIKALILTTILLNLVSEGHSHICRILYGISNL